MSAAIRLRRVRRVGPIAPALRPEAQWERIEIPSGVLIARRVPRVELLLVDTASRTSGRFASAVLVLETHQRALAAELAWPVWAHHQAGLLPAPTVGWWRQVPASDVTGLNLAIGASLWWPVCAGTPAARPGVEFAFSARNRGGQR